jgi:hypothetical protein
MNEADLEIMGAENRCDVRVCVSKTESNLQYPLTGSTMKI